MKTLSRYMLVLGLLVAGAAYADQKAPQPGAPAGATGTPPAAAAAAAGTTGNTLPGPVADGYPTRVWKFVNLDRWHQGGTIAAAAFVVYTFGNKLITVPAKFIGAIYNKLSGAVSTAAHDVCEEEQTPEVPVQP